VERVAGVRDVCGWVPVPRAESYFHGALGAAEQKEPAGVARAAKQPQPPPLRGVQARGVRQVPKGPAQDAQWQKGRPERTSIVSSYHC